MTDDVAAAYRAAFATYLEDGGEAALDAAYELGREAVRAGLSVLDLAAIHHEALLEAWRRGLASDAERIAIAGGEFFGESLSAFEMVQRGFREAREAARAEKRHTAMLRQLSAFLADTSLALEGAGALDEALRLVAEHARELVGAGWCLASLALHGETEPLVALASADPGAAPSVEEHTLYKLCVRAEAGDAADPASLAFARLLGLDRPLDGRLVARLTALDGRELGALRLFDKRGGFSDVERATVDHLAQIAAAAVERALPYARSGD